MWAACRRRAQEEIAREVPGAYVSFVSCDVSSLREVGRFADDYRRQHEKLDILAMIAGTFSTDFKKSDEGFETTLANNYLGHFYLLHLLLPIIEAAAPSRLLWMGSAFEQLGRMHWDDLGGETAADTSLDKYCSSSFTPQAKGETATDTSLDNYCSANLMCIMEAQEVQRRLRARNADVDVFTMHPGLTNSGLYDKPSWWHPVTWVTVPGARLLGQSPARGAISTVHCATAPDLQGKGWGYYGCPYLGVLAINVLQDRQFRPFNKWAHDKEAQRRLYEETADLIESKIGGPLPNRLA
ncbi:hypothetical protein N2152v2_005644 [Parachlorella kessleri]